MSVCVFFCLFPIRNMRYCSLCSLSCKVFTCLCCLDKNPREVFFFMYFVFVIVYKLCWWLGGGVESFFGADMRQRTVASQVVD